MKKNTQSPDATASIRAVLAAKKRALRSKRVTVGKSWLLRDIVSEAMAFKIKRLFLEKEK
jgi:hypothetical protein